MFAGGHQFILPTCNNTVVEVLCIMSYSVSCDQLSCTVVTAITSALTASSTVGLHRGMAAAQVKLKVSHKRETASLKLSDHD